MKMIVSLMKMIVLTALLLILTSACPNNCADCDHTTLTCHACTPPYELTTQGTCIDSNTIEKCSLYQSNLTCQTCQPTFALSNGSCLKDYSACL